MESRKLQVPEQYFDLPEETAREHVAQHLSGHFGVIMPQRHAETDVNLTESTLHNMGSLCPSNTLKHT